MSVCYYTPPRRFASQALHLGSSQFYYFFSKFTPLCITLSMNNRITLFSFYVQPYGKLPTIIDKVMRRFFDCDVMQGPGVATRNCDCQCYIEISRVGKKQSIMLYILKLGKPELPSYPVRGMVILLVHIIHPCVASVAESSGFLG